MEYHCFNPADRECCELIEIPNVWPSGARIPNVWSGFRQFGPRRGGSEESEVKSAHQSGAPEWSEAERRGGALVGRLDRRFVTPGAVGQTDGIRDKRSESGRSERQTFGISSDRRFGRMKSVWPDRFHQFGDVPISVRAQYELMI